MKHVVRRKNSPLKGILASARPGMVPSLATNALAAWGWALGQSPVGSDWLWALAIVATGLCFYLYGMWENDRVDATWDRQHGVDRPIVRGEVDRQTLRLCAVVAGLVGLGAAYGLTGDLLAGIVVALPIVSYNIVHKAWPVIGVLLMGACRSSWVWLACYAACRWKSTGLDENMWPPVWGYPVSLGLFTMVCSWVALRETECVARKKWAVALLSSMGLHDVCWLAGMHLWMMAAIAGVLYALSLGLIKMKCVVS